MCIRSAGIALALSVALFAPISAHAQSVMSLNHVVTDNLPHSECMRRGVDTIRIAGLRHFGTTDEAVWGSTNDNRYTAAVYCLTTRDIAVLAVTGTDRNRTRSIVDDLVAAWRRFQ